MSEATSAPAAPVASTEASPVDSAPGTEAKAPEAPKTPPRTFKAKVNGREVELSEDEVIQSGLTAAQIRRASQEKFDKAQKTYSEIEAWKRKAKDSPEELAYELFGDRFDEIAEQRVIKRLQMEQMDPKDRELMRAKQELEAERKKRAEYEDGQKSQREAALQRQYAEKYNTEFAEALATSGLPKTTETVRRMAQLASKALSMGLDLTAKDLVPLVRDDLAKEHTSLFGGLKGDQLLAALGPALLKEIRAADLSRLSADKPKPAVGLAKPSAPSGDGRETNPHLVSREQWLRKLGVDPDDY
jgi:hypothetical protein